MGCVLAPADGLPGVVVAWDPGCAEYGFGPVLAAAIAMLLLPAGAAAGKTLEFQGALAYGAWSPFPAIVGVSVRSASCLRCRNVGYNILLPDPSATRTVLRC